MNIIRIWKNKGQILEGITNSIFKTEHVEEIAQERLSICKSCELFDESDSKSCVVPGTHPCCNLDKGGCGCSLAFKTRSLSSGCPLDKWKAELSEQEEDNLLNTLNIDQS